MKKESKVKQVSGAGTWNSNDGTIFYKYDYLMEDGTSLNAMHKEQGKFQPGDPVEYEITRNHPTYGNSGRVSKVMANSFGGHKKNPADLQGIKIGHALNCASVLLQGTGPNREIIKMTAQMILEISEEMNAEASGVLVEDKSGIL